MPASGKGPLRVAIEDFLETFQFGRRVSEWTHAWLEDLEDATLGAFGPALDDILATPGLPAWLALLRNPKGSKRLFAVFPALIGLAAGVGLALVSSFLAPFSRLVSYRADRLAKSARLDPAAAFAVARRFPGVRATLVDHARDLGWSETLIEAFESATQALQPEADLITLWLRGDYPEPELDRELEARGWTPFRVAQLKQVRQLIPGVADLISMAVREAFDDEVAARFQYDEGRPDGVANFVAAQGLSFDWWRRYWRAHWQLPGLVQAYEMLHRLRPGRTDNPVTLDDLRTLIKTADIAPFWRDRLIEISYNPYTRVDIRRMFELGVLSPAEVHEAHLDLGYNEERARKLTDFVTRDTHAAKRDLTREAIIRGYKRRMFAREPAHTRLVAVGYDAEEADFWLDLADLELAESRARTAIDGVEQLFVAGAITEADVYGRLGPLNLAATEIAELLRDWQLRRQARVDLPTKSELADFYERQIIAADEYRRGLAERRVRAEQAEWYVQRADQEIADQARRELERAQKEQERLATAAAASEFAKANAALDTEIAEVRLAMANAKLALFEVVDPEERKALVREQIERQIEIAELVVEKAQLRTLRAG